MVNKKDYTNSTDPITLRDVNEIENVINIESFQLETFTKVI